MRLWLQAIYLISASKKGFSSNQLHRTLGVTLKTAWFMSHRIREAMRSGELAPFGANGGTCRIRRNFPCGPSQGPRRGQGYAHKRKVLSLIDRSSGCARSMVVDKVDHRASGKAVWDYDTDSLSNEQDRRAGGLLSEVIRRLCVVRSEGDPQPAQVIHAKANRYELNFQKGLSPEGAFLYEQR